ncbi:hypothetical protein RRG08_047480 [Elysia crispata]|uniref:Uncharacterized protein n=1 Tax=Elysia crispata TaxID=231223 RepID=A0AAE1DT29_9GAST|nr:hypothetical protein RRG08_047480 [Elysia crispata]
MGGLSSKRQGGDLYPIFDTYNKSFPLCTVNCSIVRETRTMQGRRTGQATLSRGPGLARPRQTVAWSGVESRETMGEGSIRATSETTIVVADYRSHYFDD